ncbi:heparanase-like protein 3 [Tanacetum coccineum]
MVGSLAGSELGANRIGASILASHYACDTNSLSDILRRIYNSTKSKPLIIAPGLEPNEKVIDLGSQNFFLCPKQTTTDARSAGNKDDEASEAINVEASYSP